MLSSSLLFGFTSFCVTYTLAQSFGYGTHQAPDEDCPPQFSWDDYQTAPKTVVNPVPNPYIDPNDVKHLKPDYDASLYYSSGGADGVAVVLNYTMSFPQVTVENSAYIKSCNCSTQFNTLALAFSTGDALHHAENWPTNNLVLITNAPGCSDQLDERGIFLTQSSSVDRDTLEVTFSVKQVSWEDVSDTLTIGYGSIVPVEDHQAHHWDNWDQATGQDESTKSRYQSPSGSSFAAHGSHSASDASAGTSTLYTTAEASLNTSSFSTSYSSSPSSPASPTSSPTITITQTDAPSNSTTPDSLSSVPASSSSPYTSLGNDTTSQAPLSELPSTITTEEHVASSTTPPVELSGSTTITESGQYTKSNSNSTTDPTTSPFPQSALNSTSTEDTFSSSTITDIETTSTSIISLSNTTMIPSTTTVESTTGSAELNSSTTTASTTAPSSTATSNLTPEQKQELYDQVMSIVRFEDGFLILPDMPAEYTFLQTEYLDPDDVAKAEMFLEQLQKQGLPTLDEDVEGMEIALQSAATETYAITPDMQLYDQPPAGYEAYQVANKRDINTLHLVRENYVTNSSFERRQSDDEDNTTPVVINEEEKKTAADKEKEFYLTILNVLGELGCELCAAVAGVFDLIELIDSLANPPLKQQGSTSGDFAADISGLTLWNSAITPDSYVRCTDCWIQVNQFELWSEMTLDFRKKKVVAATLRVQMSQVMKAYFQVKTSAPTAGKFDLASGSQELNKLEVPGHFVFYPRFIYSVGLKFDATFPIDTTAGMTYSTSSSLTYFDFANGGAKGNSQWTPRFDLTYPSFDVAYSFKMMPFFKSRFSVALDVFGKRYDEIAILTTHSALGFESRVLDSAESDQCPKGAMKLNAALSTTSTGSNMGMSETLFQERYPLGSRCFKRPAPPQADKDCPPGYKNGTIYEFNGKRFLMQCGKAFEPTAFVVDSGDYDGFTTLGDCVAWCQEWTSYGDPFYCPAAAWSAGKPRCFKNFYPGRTSDIPLVDAPNSAVAVWLM